MERYIDVTKADVSLIDTYFFNEITAGDVQAWLDKQPTADVQEVKHGKWVRGRGRRRACSCCETDNPYKRNYKAGYSNIWYSPFCPNCGAKMDGKE